MTETHSGCYDESDCDRLLPPWEENALNSPTPTKLIDHVRARGHRRARR